MADLAFSASGATCEGIEAAAWEDQCEREEANR